MLQKLLLEVFNRLFALLFLIISLPLWAVISLAIKLDSKGPVFFCQKRYGYRGKIFTCLKFRTMRTDAPPNVAKIDLVDRDKLLTKIGRKLSKLCLDELPQLVNILIGDMVLVGWRPVPITELEVHKLRQEKGIYHFRPGITGFTQTEQDRAGVFFKPDKQVAHDYFYVENWSPWFDTKIIFSTVIFSVLSGKHSLQHPITIKDT